jgi:hypothetical protein
MAEYRPACREKREFNSGTRSDWIRILGKSAKIDPFFLKSNTAP